MNTPRVSRPATRTTPDTVSPPARKKDGVKLLSVVLKSEAYQQDDGSWYYGNFADTRTLFEWGFNNFSYQDVLKSTETVTEVPVAMGGRRHRYSPPEHDHPRLPAERRRPDGGRADDHPPRRTSPRTG